ncbi:BTB/POZ domain-containing protein [Sesamum angolense]|uniref:BTB/POZ domain-containing protein n=1 Tax=Sesamum angolense TaxID=2727404 RepID=A0AAE1WSR0_9LAMI|nr:BTB/POZ domain-containing protein [Sesamum angolense]
MRSSAKHGAPENARGISAHVLTLHQRLYHALNLGSSESRGKWQCPDIEIQRLVLRSVDAFLDCISTETLQYPLVKDSVVDMVRALGSILEFKSQSILRLASSVVAKLVNILPSPMLQSHVLDLISPLADLLSSQQVPVAISCATSMNVILTKISSRQEREVSLILDETKVVGYLVHNVKQFCVDDKPIEYIQEMASVLSKILWRWSSFRFCVWSDPKFLSILDAMRLVPGNSKKLLSCSSLCGYGAEKLLENGETLLQMMVGCMDSSNTYSVRMEAFKLARCLMESCIGIQHDGSGALEFHMQTIKVPVRWESLNKLVGWFYSEQLPEPTFDCIWDNMDPEEKFREIQSYLELCWLAEFWLIEDLHEECYKVVISCLDSSRYLSTKIIQIAANFSLWKLAQVAAEYMAPSYHHLRYSGDLDALDSNLVEMVRAASVRLSQEGSRQFS